MASIQRIVSPLTKEVSYRAQVRVKGRSESLTFSSRTKAKKWAATVESAIEDGKHFPNAAARRTSFDALADAYVKKAVPKLKESQRHTREQQITWWAEQFKGLTLSEITPKRIADTRDICAAETYTRGKPRRDKKTGELIPPRQLERSAATVNRYVAALSAALSFAASPERGMISDNPVSKITREKEAKGRIRFLSDDERERLLAACAKSAWPPLYALVLLAITSGARRSEMTSLKWDDVDMTAGRALVRESKNEEPRTLIIAGEALKALQALYDERAAKPKDERSEFVFPNPSGMPGAIKFFDSDWHAALDAAAIKGFRFHDLRHTCASYLAAQKCSLLEIADVLGHKTLAMVKRYSHLVVDHKAGVIERMVAAKGL